MDRSPVVGTGRLNQWTVPQTLDRFRLDRALAHLMGGTRSHAQMLIKTGCVTLNGGPAIVSKQEVRAGDHLAFEEVPLQEIVATPRELDIVYEDDALIVLNKPAGLVVHPAPGHSADTLVNALAAREEISFGGEDPLRPGIVHRLDKDTSGLLVVAKTSAVHEALARQFRPSNESGELTKMAQRTYLGLVYGKPLPSTGRIQNYLGRHRSDRQRWAVCSSRSASGKLAITDYTVLRKWSSSVTRSARTHPSWISLVRFHLLTGRTHQIRVHCEHAGFPLVGDPVYTKHAPHKGTWPTPIATFPRQALHAHTLQFMHPVIQTRMTFESPLPNDIAQLVQTLNESEGQEP